MTFFIFQLGFCTENCCKTLKLVHFGSISQNGKKYGAPNTFDGKIFHEIDPFNLDFVYKISIWTIVGQLADHGHNSKQFRATNYEWAIFFQKYNPLWIWILNGNWKRYHVDILIYNSQMSNSGRGGPEICFANFTST